MTRLRLRWTRRALKRLDEIGDYISTDNQSAAQRVIAELVAKVEILAEFPETGRIGRVGNTRELVFSGLPYIVVYQRIRDEIQIVTIIHTSRQWPTQF
jgi:addiction module RelE/StbE family toxin